MPTPLYPTFKKRVGDAFEQLIKKQVIPWSFMTASPPFRIKFFDGKEIAYGEIAFEQRNGTGSLFSPHDPLHMSNEGLLRPRVGRA